MSDPYDPYDPYEQSPLEPAAISWRAPQRLDRKRYSCPGRSRFVLWFSIGVIPREPLPTPRRRLSKGEPTANPAPPSSRRRNSRRLPGGSSFGSRSILLAMNEIVLGSP